MRFRLGSIKLAFSLILFGVVVAQSARAGQVGKDIYSGIFGSSSIEDRIALTVKDINKTLPRMISEDVRIDPATAGPGKRLTYNYTVFSENTSQNMRTNISNLRHDTCKSKHTVFFLSKGATIVYSYHATNGAELFKLTVEPSDCR